MGFYDLSKEKRTVLVKRINQDIAEELSSNKRISIRLYFSDEDTYIRKTAYLAIGKLYKSKAFQDNLIISTLQSLLNEEDPKIRQTTINAAGEIGMSNFSLVTDFFNTGLFDPHHSVRNAVIGSVKKMGQKNPIPVLAWAKKYLHHPNKEIRREICHGIELRGRTHPQEILPLLEELQYDTTARVRNTLVHVLGQIAYKKGCLEVVVQVLNQWENQELVREALDEIVDVHKRYKSFSFYTQEEAMAYIDQNYKVGGI